MSNQPNPLGSNPNLPVHEEIELHPHPAESVTTPVQYGLPAGALPPAVVSPVQERLPSRAATLDTAAQPALSPFTAFSPSATIAPTPPRDYFPVRQGSASSLVSNASGVEVRHRVPTFPLTPPAQSAPDDDAVNKPSSSMRWWRKYFTWQGFLEFSKAHATLIGIFVVLATVSISIGVGWAIRLRSFNGVDLVDDDDLPPGTNTDRNVTLLANLINIDPSSQVMSLDWLIDYPACDPPLISNSMPTPCETLQNLDCPDINLYFDQNLLRTDGGSSTTSSNVLATPIFTINGTNLCTLASREDQRPNSLYFRTDIAITSMGTGRTLQSYPFDKYIAQIVMYAELLGTNQSIPVFLQQTTGLAVGFNAKMESSGIADQFDTVVKDIVITRGAVVRAYAICIVLAVWLVTLCFMGTCVVNVFFGKGVAAEVLVLPVATLFAFTALRSTLPGAPAGFGADIDFVGVLPCLALLTFCSVFMTAIFLFRRDPSQDAPWFGTKKQLEQQIQIDLGKTV